MEYSVIDVCDTAYGWCTFSSLFDASCDLTGKHCGYGLCDVHVPDHCPLRHGAIAVTLRECDHTTWKAAEHE